MLLRNLIRRIFFQYMYFRNPPWDTGVSPPELMEFIHSNPPGRAIDLGCGTGTNVITLAKNGWQVTGVDFIPKAIRSAHRKIRAEGVTAKVEVADVTKLKIPGESFDMALDIGCYHNLTATDKMDYERNLLQLLAEDGAFLLYGFLGTNNDGFGIFHNDLERLQKILVLDSRKDGMDRDRPSAWFRYVKTHRVKEQVNK